jgi:hypothetical protein
MIVLLFEWGEITGSVWISRVNKIVFSCKYQKSEYNINIYDLISCIHIHMQNDYREEGADNWGT